MQGRGARWDAAEDIDHEGDEHPDRDRVIAPLLKPEEGRMNENEHPRGALLFILIPAPDRRLLGEHLPATLAEVTA